MDVTVTVCIGSYSVDIAAEGTDALFLGDALHQLREHIAEQAKVPSVRKAMTQPLVMDMD